MKPSLFNHVKRKHQYHPSPGGNLRRGLSRVRKELARRYYQLLMGHAATAEYLMRVGQSPSSKCWWCGSGERQSRYHLFIRFRRWAPEIRRLWQRAERNCEWESPRAPSAVSSSATPERRPHSWSSLRMPRWAGCQAKFSWVEGWCRRERLEARRARRRIGRTLPSRMFSFFLSPFLPFLFLFFLFPSACLGDECRGWLRKLVRGRKRLVRKACRCPRGQRQIAAMALRAQYSGLQI